MRTKSRPDKSFFFFDTIVKRAWISRDSRPVVTITDRLSKEFINVWSHYPPRKAVK